MSIMRAVSGGGYSSHIPITARTIAASQAEETAGTPRTMDIIHGPITWTDTRTGVSHTFSNWPCWPDWRYCAYTFRYRFQKKGRDNGVCTPQSTFAISSWSAGTPIYTGKGVGVYDDTATSFGFATPIPRPLIYPHSTDDNYCYATYWDSANWGLNTNDGTQFNYTSNQQFFSRVGSTALVIGDQYHNYTGSILGCDTRTPPYFAKILSACPNSRSGAPLGANQLYFPEHWMIFSTSSPVDVRCFGLDMDVMYTDSDDNQYFDFCRNSLEIPANSWRGHSNMQVVTPSAGTVKTYVHYCNRNSAASWAGWNTLIDGRNLGNRGAKCINLGQFGSEYFYVICNFIETSGSSENGDHLALLNSQYSSLPAPRKNLLVSPPMLSFRWNETGSGTIPYLPGNVRVSIWEWGVDFWGAGKIGVWNDPSGEVMGWKRCAMKDV